MTTKISIYSKPPRRERQRVTLTGREKTRRTIEKEGVGDIANQGSKNTIKGYARSANFVQIPVGDESVLTTTRHPTHTSMWGSDVTRKERSLTSIGVNSRSPQSWGAQVEAIMHPRTREGIGGMLPIQRMDQRTRRYIDQADSENEDYEAAEFDDEFEDEFEDPAEGLAYARNYIYLQGYNTYIHTDSHQGNYCRFIWDVPGIGWVGFNVHYAAGGKVAGSMYARRYAGQFEPTPNALVLAVPAVRPNTDVTWQNLP